MVAEISIVTPSFNQGQFLEETINSVLDQQYPNVEYIIIDGGSTDNTVAIIKKYAQHLKYWISEKDKGQADAINKGLEYCTGKIFNWLNSDDYLQPGALKKIAEAFENDTVDLVAGKINNFTINTNDVQPNQHLSAAGIMRWDKDVKLFQPAVWMRKKLFDECGGVNKQFHYSFDWDMLIRYLSLFPNVKYLDDILVNFRLHDESKTVSSYNKFVAEERVIIEELYTKLRYEKLHGVCKWKIDRSNWTKFLHDTSNNNGKSKISKIAIILQHISDQPFDVKIARMTVGAIRQILKG